MTIEQLQHIILQGENAIVEFKQSFNKAVIETLMAFANTSGGKVLLGVKDDGDIVGLDISQESVQHWINEIKQKTEPAIIPEAQLFEIENKRVLLFSVLEHPIKPISVQKPYI